MIATCNEESLLVSEVVFPWDIIKEKSSFHFMRPCSPSS